MKRDRIRKFLTSPTGLKIIAGLAGSSFTSAIYSLLTGNYGFLFFNIAFGIWACALASESKKPQL